MQRTGEGANPIWSESDENADIIGSEIYSFTIRVYETFEEYECYHVLGNACVWPPFTEPVERPNTAPYFESWNQNEIIELTIGEEYVIELPIIVDDEADIFQVTFIGNPTLISMSEYDAGEETLTLSPGLGDVAGFYRPIFKITDELGAFN